MIAEKPKNINFLKLENDCKTIIGNLEMLLELIKRDIDILKHKDKLTLDEQKELAFMLIEKTKTSYELEAKKLVYNEYVLRCKEYEDVTKAEKDDYIACSGAVIRQAQQYEYNPNLLPELRKHLKEVLSQPTKHFDLDQKIAFHLALKKEVELCKNYLDSIK